MSTHVRSSPNPSTGVDDPGYSGFILVAVEKLIRSKLFVAGVIILPGLWPAWPLFVAQDPSFLADPPKYVLHHLGFTASVILAVVLALTPLRTIFPRWRLGQVVQRHRRFIGVSAFVYAACHVTMHFIYEGGFGTFATDWKKPFITVGVIAFTILFILAVTSPHFMVRRLGGRRWKWIHRLIYIAAALVVYHQISARKVFPMQVVWIFGPVLALEAMRIARTVQSRMRPVGNRMAGS